MIEIGGIEPLTFPAEAASRFTPLRKNSFGVPSAAVRQKRSPTTTAGMAFCSSVSMGLFAQQPVSSKPPISKSV